MGKQTLGQKIGESFLMRGVDVPLDLALEAIGTLLGPYKRDMSYAANRTGLQASPSPDSVIKSFWAGKFGAPNQQSAQDSLAFLLGEHGIHFQGNTNITARRSSGWFSHVQLTKPTLPIEVYRRALYTGGYLPNAAIFDSRIRREGIYEEWDKKILKELPESLSVDEIFRLWSAGIIDRENAIRLFKASGQTEQRQLDYLLQLFEVPSLIESLTLRNRGVINDAELDDYLGRHGFRRQEERERLAGLRFEIPGPSDLVRFAVRHVFEPSLAEEFGFDAEISEDFVEWHKRQGFGMEFKITDPINKKQYDMNWAKAHWWSHWVWPSATQGYTMLHRLRPTGGVNGGPRSPNGLKFTQRELGLLLRGLDYPQHWRPFLAEISFRVIETAQIKQCWKAGIFDDTESTERLQDVGYTKADAEILTKLNANEAKWENLQRLISRIRFKTIAAYKEGITSRQDAGVILYGLALPNLARYTEYNAKPLDEQRKIAQADNITQSILDVVDTDLEVSLAKEAIAAVKKGFLRFEINEQQALQALLQIGVFQVRAQKFVETWKWEFYGRGKTLAVGQITRSLVRGIMLPNVAVQRLMLLGYSQVDALALVSLAMQDQRLYLERLRERSASSLAKQQRALISQQKALQKTLLSAQQRLARSASKSRLMKWYGKGYINKSEFDKRLIVLGVLPHDIPDYEKEALNGTGKKA